MDREHLKGAAEKAKRAMKDVAGKLTGDKELQGEGKLDKAQGDVHNAIGNAKNAAHSATDGTKRAPDTSPSEADIADGD
jgi:uncharacterized protein YjbJ (UPF0337 family)